MNIEDKLTLFCMNYPQLHSLILYFLEGNIPDEEIDRFLAMNEEDRKCWVMMQLDNIGNITKEKIDD